MQDEGSTAGTARRPRRPPPAFKGGGRAPTVSDPANGPPHPFPENWADPSEPGVEPRDLAMTLASPNPPLLLDIRSGDERALASFPETLWIPLEELPRRVAEVPRDRAVVVFDSFGHHSNHAVRILYHAGHPWVAELKGGFDGYARDVDPTLPRFVDAPEPDPVLLFQLPRPATGCLAYLLGDAAQREAVVIDPGADPDPYLAILREHNWRLRAIVETHTHADHLAGHARLHERTDAPIWLGRRSPAEYPHRSLAEGDHLEFGDTSITTIETPGHTRDHVSLLMGSKLFTGDTLLVGSCGRTDLGDGDPEALWESLRTKLQSLPPTTEVLPAHFGAHHALPERFSSTLAVESATNDALRLATREEFLRYMTEGWPPRPDDFDAIVRQNLAAF